MFIGGPDITASCELCDGGNLPGAPCAADVSNLDAWDTRLDRSQYMRTNPLSGDVVSSVWQSVRICRWTTVAWSNRGLKISSSVGTRFFDFPTRESWSR